ncbi:methyltransferase-like protein 27 isoform X3 [Amphiura filiformis]|uniref:methyltransferase-like protein 27 isoform X3 n=1 Tax=Amphiura filiformis TaxID=82378 RepID=UPI003B218E3E
MGFKSCKGRGEFCCRHDCIMLFSFSSVDTLYMLLTNLPAFQDFKRFGYNGPQVAASILADHLPDKNARILDFCSGTGMVGEQLKMQQFINIDAIDMSPNSLKVSEEKQVYKTLICSEIGSDPLDIKCYTYDGLVCCGSFVPGHLNQSCFPEMIRIVKPGGIIVISMREEYLWTAKEFQNNQLEEAI